jgi:hypothetical protein
MRWVGPPLVELEVELDADVEVELVDVEPELELVEDAVDVDVELLVEVDELVVDGDVELEVAPPVPAPPVPSGTPLWTPKIRLHPPSQTRATTESKSRRTCMATRG